MAFLVDSNIILDIVTEDPEWFDWSSSTLSLNVLKRENCGLIPSFMLRCQLVLQKLKSWMMFFCKQCFTAQPFLGRPDSWQASVSCAILRQQEIKRLLCSIFTYERMRPFLI